MPMAFANPIDRSRQIALAARMVRLQNPHTGDFLHLSGSGSTRDVNLSWLGFIRQADTLRERAAVRGEDFPFVAVERDLIDRQAP